jgi:VWFA-related protein
MKTSRAIFAPFLCLTLVAQQPSTVPTFQTGANLVMVTVYVRDRAGNPIPNLNKDDFLILENGKPQRIAVFEYQNLASDAPAPAGAIEPAPAVRVPAAAAPPAEQPRGSIRYRDRRLLVLFFDWSSLATADQIFAIEAAEKFVREQMTPADLLSIMTYGARLKVEQEFTGDKDLLMETIHKFQAGQMSELAVDGSTDVDTSDDAQFMADDTEFNVFNTDRKLSVIEDIAHKLEALPEKKAIVYFSSGVTRTGVDNDSQLRATINAAVRANVSLYPIDARGLVAVPPAGAASAPSPRGTGIYTGQTQASTLQGVRDKQETLYTLAADTGGKAFLDSNDLILGIVQAQKDIQSYYALGYYSTDERRDGQFRKVEVKLLNKIQAKVDYRSGYYADKDFRAFNSYDKEKQLQDALLLGDPITKLPIALEVNYFRLAKDRYFVPIAVKIPGSEIPIAKKGEAETTKFDFIGQIRSSKGALAASVRDEIKIQLREQAAGRLASRSLVYDTGFVLTPGAYRLKMLVRENLTGKMGTFETAFVIPDLVGVAKDSLRVSSVVWSNQRQPISAAVGVADRKVRKQESHPLVRDGQKLIPSVTRVFRADQNLYVYAEVYDSATVGETEKPMVAATVSLYLDDQKAAESRAIEVRGFLGGRAKTAPVLLELPLKGLKPGNYMAQLSLIDQAGKRFAFERAKVVIVKAQT